jgi:peptide/nickel transport system permease protein
LKALSLIALRRLVHAFLVVMGVSVVVFIVTHLIGDPVHLMLPLDASQTQYAALSHQLGLDQSLGRQFVDYFGEIFRGDFGKSYWQSEPALRIAFDHVLPTVELGAAAIVLSAIFGIVAGFVAAVHAGGVVDRVVGAISMLGVSIASFWLALVLIMLFAVRLHWFPTSGIGLRNIVLPAVAAASSPFGRLTQVARAAMVDELGQPYVRAARAKGLSTARVVALHASRNALIPVVTLAAFEFAAIVGAGLVLVETIFNWPGIGYLTYQALSHRDFPLIQACVSVIAIIVVVTNLLVDALYGIIDPRTRIAA